MRIFLILMALIPLNSFAQNKITIVDSITKQALPYVAVLFNDDGLYTDENGQIKLPSKEVDAFLVKHLGYHPKKLIKSKAKDTIFLKPRDITLAPIVIDGNRKDIEISPGKKASGFGTFPLAPEISIYSILYPRDKHQDKSIKEITIQFGKAIPSKFRRKLRKSNTTALLRIHIYKIKNGKLEQTIYNSNLLEIIPSKKDEVTVNLKDKNIYFSEQGVGVEIEFIKFISDPKSNEIDKTKSYIRPLLTEEENEFFHSTTYLKSTLKQNDITPLNHLYNNHRTNHKKTYYRNLSIGLKIN